MPTEPPVREPWQDRTAGRVCRWYDTRGEVTQLSLDVWDVDHELVTTVVVHLGPFDDLEVMEATLVRLLNGQQALF